MRSCGRTRWPQIRARPQLRPQDRARTGKSRNGYSAKTVLTEEGAVELAIPRDRNGTFEPQIVPKGSRRLEGFDERIVSL